MYFFNGAIKNHVLEKCLKKKYRLLMNTSMISFPRFKKINTKHTFSSYMLTFNFS